MNKRRTRSRGARTLDKQGKQELLEFTKNTEWISKNYDTLRRKYPEKYIAVYKKEGRKDVWAHSPSRGSLLKQLKKKELGSEKGVAVHFVTSKSVKFLV